MADARKQFIEPAKFFLLASLVIGILYCVVIPYGAGFDEERHLIRIYYISQNHFLPNFPKPTLYEEVIELSYQRRLVQTPAFDMLDSSNFWKRFSKLEKHIRYGVKTQSIYSPVIFLPQVLIAKILWWRLDFAVLPTILLMKIAGLLVYIAGAYTAIRVLPYGKWVFTVLALLPAALYQAATLNADGFTAGVSFVFIGWVLAVHHNENVGIRPRSVWILVALSILLGLAKPGAIVLLTLLLILWKRPFPSGKWIALLLFGVLISILVNLGWWMMAARGSIFAGEGAQNLASQSSQILTHPSVFLKLLVQSIVATFPFQVQGWMAAYGYGAGKVPEPVYFFAALSLLAALVAEPARVTISNAMRIFLITLFVFCSVLIYTIAYVPNYVVGGILALAKQGRYYIPFVPLFFLGITGLGMIPERVRRLSSLVAVSSLLLATVGFLFGIYTTYYTYCGYDAYRGAKCVLPMYKNLEKEDTLDATLHDGEQVTQTFTRFCGNLERVDVFVKSVPNASQGSLKFSVRDEHNQLVASQDIPLRTIVANDYLDLAIPATSNINSIQYKIQLEAQHFLPQEALTVALTTSNYYPGEFSMPGTSTRDDLLIHYTCTTP